jgi:hypothetical protein
LVVRVLARLTRTTVGVAVTVADLLHTTLLAKGTFAVRVGEDVGTVWEQSLKCLVLSRVDDNVVVGLASFRSERLVVDRMTGRGLVIHLDQWDWELNLLFIII